MTSAPFLFLLLEYLKVFASAPVILGLIAWGFRSSIRKFLDRVDKAEWGAAKLSAPQQASQNALAAIVESVAVEVPVEGVAITGTITQALPAVSSQGTAHVGVPSDCEERLKATEANATLWEYKFFNLLLVAKTQFVLD